MRVAHPPAPSRPMSLNRQDGHVANGDARRQVRKSRCYSLAVLGLLLTSATGCGYVGNWVQNGFKVGPEYCRPAVPVADAWIDFNDPRVISEHYGVDNAAWWYVFNDPVMADLVQASYTQNLPLRVAGAARAGGAGPTRHRGWLVVSPIPNGAGPVPADPIEPQWKPVRSHSASEAGRLICGRRAWAWPGRLTSGAASAGISNRPTRTSMRRSRTMTTCWCV